MFPREDANTWGPRCRLVRTFADLRNQTAHGRVQVAGIGKLYTRVNETWRDHESMQLSALTKGRIEQLLDGGGLPPTWDEARTLYRALHRLASEAPGAQTSAIDDENLRMIVEATHALPPYRRAVASHFASRALEWGQQNAIQYVQREIENREIWLRDNDYWSHHSDDIKKSWDELHKNRERPKQAIEGAVAFTHSAPTPPLYYQDIFVHKMVSELRDYQEQKIMRLDGHSIHVNIEYLETGIRLTYSIARSGSYVKGFVAIEVSSLGGVAVYFRWIPTQDNKLMSMNRLVRWGLVGAVEMCLHVHALMAASGEAHAYFILPGHMTGDMGFLPFSEPGLYKYSSSWDVMTAHFGSVIQHLTGEEDFKKFLVDAKQEYWASFWQ